MTDPQTPSPPTASAPPTADELAARLATAELTVTNLLVGLGELHAALDQQGQQTQAGLADAAQAGTQRALQLVPFLPVQTGGPLAGPRLRLVIPDGASLVDVASLAAWLTQQLAFVVDVPASLAVPRHLRRYFQEVPGQDMVATKSQDEAPRV